MLGAAFGLGFIVGPAVGGALGAISPRLPFWVAAALSLSNAMYGLIVLPESLPPEKRTPFSLKHANPLGALTLLRSHPMLLRLAGACIFQFLAHEVLPNTFVIYTDFRYGWTPRDVGFALAAIGLFTTIVSAAGVGPAVKRLGERRAAAVGMLFGAAFFVAAGSATTGLLFALALPIEAPFGLAGPSIQGLMSRHIGPGQQGQLQGAIGSVRGITGMIGPVLFTQTFAAAIAPGQTLRLPGAPYWLAGALLCCGRLVMWRVTRASETATVPDAT